MTKSYSILQILRLFACGRFADIYPVLTDYGNIWYDDTSQSL